MAADKPGRDGNAKGEDAGSPSRHRFETFGPVTSLEPDGAEPLGEGAEVRERFTVSVTWESVAVKPRQPAPGETGEEGPAVESAPAGEGGSREAAKRRKTRRSREAGGMQAPGRNKEKLLESIRGEESPAAAGPSAEASAETPAADWTHAMAGKHDPGREDAESIFLLDDAFLRKTFKEVNFPASKELVLRYVDQEQDFAWGHDRTVNLHNLITHLEEDGFRTRRDLLHAIKERLGAHPAGRRQE